MIETIIFRIGGPQDRQDYTVHKSFATKSSRAIQDLLNNRENAQPNRSNRIRISNLRPAVFEVYVYWLYTDKIVTTDTKGMNSYGTTLVRLYILAEYLKDEPFSEAVFEILSELCEDKTMVFESDAVNLIWENLPRDEVLRITFLEAMVASALGKPDCARFIGSHDWPDEVDPESIMEALEQRQYAGFFFYGEDSSEIGEALTSLLGPVGEEL